MDSVAIHCNKGVEWQAKRAPQLLAGLRALRIPAHITDSRLRESDIAILLGTTFWREVESTGRYMLVDRASVGDPRYVQLVWDGHGRRGNHRVPPSMMGRRLLDIKPQPWKVSGRRVVICGQTEPYSPHFNVIDDWYDSVDCATHFRSHPMSDNPTKLLRVTGWKNVRRAITLNSSVGVDTVLRGIPTVAIDEGSMAWDVTSHDPEKTITPDRKKWLQWLSCTQWHWDEIEAGRPIKHLFEAI